MFVYEKKFTSLLNGERFAYIEKGEGNGETLVILHGNMASGVSVLPLVDGVCEKVHCYAPDLRGFGDSSYNNEFRTMKEMANDVFLFCKSLGIESAHFAGWSTAAPVALELAVMYPSLVKSVMGICSVSVRGHYMFPRDKNGKPLTDKPFESYEEMAADENLCKINNAFLSGNRDFMKKIWETLLFETRVPDKDEYEILLSENAKERCQKNINWAWSVENMSTIPTVYARGDGTINLIKCPCTLIVGDRDYIKHQTMENLSLIKGAKLRELPLCGHVPFVDCPDLLSQAVLDSIFGKC